MKKMKKILSIAAVSAVALMLATGCASNGMKAHIGKTDESTVKTAIYIGDLSTKKAMFAIEEAAKKTDWRITEFKSNAVIVEKAVDGETISRTITVYNKHISGDEKASGGELQDLRKAIVEELQKKE
jgi:hypothetical protein